uniref:MRG domain binding protein n=1 Tax=Gouania willdenowi TaxID=441366 RepID=A0A8C5DKI8_GOUWI
MGEADVLLTQAEEKRPEPGLLPAEDPVVWSHEVEVCLFHAMIGHKPVGVNRHFHMICIRDKFSQNIGRQVSSSIIWDHLGSMYDMQALHESEILPFPNSEKSFSLPDDIIQEVKEGKLVPEEETKEEFRMERETPSAQEEGNTHTHTLHTLHIIYTHTLHTLYTHYTNYTHTHTHYTTHIIHTLYTHYTLYTHTLYTLYTHTLHTLHIIYTHTLHTLYTHTTQIIHTTHITHTHTHTHFIISQLILPIIDYSDIIYQNTTATILQPLNITYNSLCRFILHCPFRTHH